MRKQNKSTENLLSLLLIPLALMSGFGTAISGAETEIDPNLVYLDIAFPNQIAFPHGDYTMDPLRTKVFFEGRPIVIEVGIINENATPVTISEEGKNWEENLTVVLMGMSGDKVKLTKKDLIPLEGPKRRFLNKSDKPVNVVVDKPNTLRSFEAISLTWQIPNLSAGEYEVSCDYEVKGLTYLHSRRYKNKLNSSAARKKIKIITPKTFEDELNFLFHKAVDAERTGDIAKSNEYLQELLKRHPTNLVAYAQLGSNSLKVGDKIQALNYFGKFIEIAKSGGDRYNKIARDKFGLEDWVANVEQLIERIKH